jgi:hypothetical protein
MELERIQAPRFVSHGGQRRIVAFRDRTEPRRQRDHPVAVTRPHIQDAAIRRVAVVGQAIEQTRASQRPDLCRSEFLMRRGADRNFKR